MDTWEHCPIRTDLGEKLAGKRRLFPERPNLERGWREDLLSAFHVLALFSAWGKGRSETLTLDLSVFGESRLCGGFRWKRVIMFTK